MEKCRDTDAKRRFGTEFNVAEFPCGPTTIAPLDGTHFLAIGFAAVAVPPLVTSSFWVRCISGSIKLTPCHVDGVAADGIPLLLPEDGWVHSSIAYQSFSGHLSGLSIYGQPNAVFQFALPALVPGDFRGVIHGAPIPAPIGD